MAIPISAIVLTKNEEENLPGCLETLAWADEILVVDSFSTDRTIEIAQSMGARVIQHPFTNFAAQRNYAQSQARYDWVLFIDADERVSPELRDEILALSKIGRLAEYNAYHIQRVHLFSGRWIPDPSRRRVTPRLRKWIRRVEVPRLFDRRLAVWERPLHEVVRVPEPHGVLDGVIYHYAMSNLSLVYESLNYYTDLEAAYLHCTRRQASLIEAIFRGVRSFVYHYLFAGLWRYGEQGLLLAITLGYTKFVNYAKLWERIRIQSGQGVWAEQDRKLLKCFDNILDVEKGSL
ncbi:MAG: glycosyltransferase family 2 protein [Candidatus Methanosuratincola sp.]